MHLQFTGLQSKFKTENIENNNLAKFEIGKAILPTLMKFSTDHVLAQTVANQSTSMQHFSDLNPFPSMMNIVKYIQV